VDDAVTVDKKHNNNNDIQRSEEEDKQQLAWRTGWYRNAHFARRTWWLEVMEVVKVL
jgi:hypothetical protein